MISFLSDDACLPIMGDGRRWVESEGYMGRRCDLGLVHRALYVAKMERGLPKVSES